MSGLARVPVAVRSLREVVEVPPVLRVLLVDGFPQGLVVWGEMVEEWWWWVAELEHHVPVLCTP